MNVARCSRPAAPWVLAFLALAGCGRVLGIHDPVGALGDEGGADGDAAEPSLQDAAAGATGTSRGDASAEASAESSGHAGGDGEGEGGGNGDSDGGGDAEGEAGEGGDATIGGTRRNDVVGADGGGEGQAPDAAEGGVTADGGDAAAGGEIWSVELSSSVVLGNVGDLSRGFGGYLSLTRASPATVQTSAVTIDTSPGNDDARIGSLGQGFQGLVVEEARTNILPSSRNWTGPFATSGWSDTGNAAMTTGLPSPDGTMNATRIVTAAVDQGGDYTSGPTPAGTYVASGWARGTSGDTWWQPSSPAHGEFVNVIAVPGTSWGRYSWIYTSPGSSFGTFETSELGAEPSIDVQIDLIGLELGTFPTESIVSPTDGPATRAGDHLFIADGARAVDGGTLSIYLKMVPKAATDGYSALAYLFYADKLDFAYLDPNASALTVAIGGTTVTGSVPRFQALAPLEWFIVAGNGRVRAEYRAGGAAGTVTTLVDKSVTATLAPPTTIDLLSSGAANQFSSWLERVAVYTAGAGPEGF